MDRAIAVSKICGNSAALRRYRRISPRMKCLSYKRFTGSCNASEPAARSMAGQTVATRAKGSSVSPLTRQLEHQVAAHRVADERHPLQPELTGIVAHHRGHIRRQTRVIQRWRQFVRVAAIAHVHANHVAAHSQCSRREPPDVLRLRRPLKAVNQDHRQPVRSHRQSGCQSQKQTTRLPSSGSTSTVSATAVERNGGAADNCRQWSADVHW